MRRLIIALSILSLVAFVGAAVASAAPQQPQHAQQQSAMTRGAASFTLTGSVAGGLSSTQFGLPVTFVFTETNRGTSAAPVDLHVTKTANLTNIAQGCVLPNGSEFTPDGSYCEPGFIKPGQSSRLILQGVAGNPPSPGVTSARVCLVNENTGVTGPCLTVSVKNP